MTDQIEMPEESLTPRGVGPQLRVAREKLGLTIEQVAANTRISQRFIAAIEAGDFGALPGRTYAVGFARNMAKVVGLDQGDVAAMVRAELGAFSPDMEDRRATFEPGDPARAPSGRLAWFSLFAVVLLVAGLYFVARIYFSPAVELPSLVQQQQAEEAEAAALAAADRDASQQPANPAGAVVFTATEDGVWVRFYDQDNQRLMEKEMALGESYTVPADARGPQLWTGRPDALSITVGGRAIPRLADGLVTMRDVAVDGASLMARSQPAASAAQADPATAQ
ncbi:hypothetical protein GCM10009127_26970 [Alteraurantiacibacter aestuarii]|uniref:DUF4115 domain-containing protein n=1 Tax=Alteraurantiacibacter aestuarii TaxID=650004 RepID=A0A844ZTB0_9SPHN|nr:helix-turn-helix domain-containing protein [Alteraurantiacibacter aestuarii]MXO88809.1 DUF4115 domain-containing protein [Alteraurantiacibacter aestuarii]